MTDRIDYRALGLQLFKCHGISHVGLTRYCSTYWTACLWFDDGSIGHLEIIELDGVDSIDALRGETVVLQWCKYTLLQVCSALDCRQRKLKKHAESESR